MTGAELRRRLHNAGLSAYALAPKVGVERHTVYSWLAGRRQISEPLARLIERILEELPARR